MAISADIDTTMGTGKRSRCGVAVMAKASIPGRAKTRLVPPLSDEEAAAFNTAFLRDVFANIGAAADRASISGYAAAGPPGFDTFFQETLPPDAGSFACWFEHFGTCLRHATWTLLDRGHESAVVLNADSPTLPTDLLVETAERLAEPGDRAVLGPSDDGGYYLLGLKARHARMFEEIDWSTGRVAEQTLARARELDLPVHVLSEWYDVDDAPALRNLWGELFEQRPYGSGGLLANPAAHTAALMRRLSMGAGLSARLGLRPAAAVTATAVGATAAGGRCAR